MQSTTVRHQALLHILKEGTITRQEELLGKLSEMGINTTQATLSRDFRALGIIKVPGEGYKLSKETSKTSSAAQGVLTIEFSGQNAVIKTAPGHAPAVAAHIDLHTLKSVMGTLAGDDTLLLILRAGYSAQDTLKELSTIIPYIIERAI